MIELRTIPKDNIHDTNKVTLRYTKLVTVSFNSELFSSHCSAIVPGEPCSANERRSITICLKHQLGMIY
jgi:hypothetical protein